MRMHEGWPVTFSAILRGAPKCTVTGRRIGAVDFLEMKIRESRNQTRNAASGGLHFHRHRNRVAVILHAENYGQLVQRSGIHRFPELTFTGGAVAQGNVGDFIAAETHILEVAIVGFFVTLRSRDFDSFRMLRKVSSALRASHRLQNLRSCGGGLGHDIEPLVSPMRRHLSPAGTRIVRRSHPLQKHLQWLCPQRQAQCPVTIVRVEPVVTSLKSHPSRSADSLVTGPRHLEIYFLLPLQHDFPIVNPPGGVHNAVEID